MTVPDPSATSPGAARSMPHLRCRSGALPDQARPGSGPRAAASHNAAVAPAPVHSRAPAAGCLRSIRSNPSRRAPAPGLAPGSVRGFAERSEPTCAHLLASCELLTSSSAAMRRTLTRAPIPAAWAPVAHADGPLPGSARWRPRRRSAPRCAHLTGRTWRAAALRHQAHRVSQCSPVALR